VKEPSDSKEVKEPSDNKEVKETRWGGGRTGNPSYLKFGYLLSLLFELSYIFKSCGGCASAPTYEEEGP
jgi:hypothetical protein